MYQIVTLEGNAVAMATAVFLEVAVVTMIAGVVVAAADVPEGALG